MKVLLFSLSIPFLLTARLCELFNLWGVNKDVKKCVKVINDNADILPDRLVEFLIVAEDHRNAKHFGVDPIAMLRALYARLRKGECQGASTIEQQFVRVVTNRYERSIFRKIREQILAVSLSKYCSKALISKAYLSISFYGSGLQGLRVMKNKYGVNLTDTSDNDWVMMVARLKYPEPQKTNDVWLRKIELRRAYIWKRLSSLK